jgi:hypothetical protein
MSERLDTEARVLIDRRAANDKAQKAAKGTKLLLDEQQQLVHKLLEDLGMKTATLELGTGYGTVQVGRRQTIRSRVFDMEKALAWLSAHGRREEMTRDEVRKAPMNELVRECLETGQPLPEGVDYTTTPFVQVTRKDK